MKNVLKICSMLCCVLFLMGSVAASPKLTSVSQKSDSEYQFSGLGLRQATGDVKDTINRRQLSGLQGGELTTSQGDTHYWQELSFEDPTNPIQPWAVNYVKNDNDEVGDFLVIDNKEPFYQWRQTFNEGLSGVVDQYGHITDFEGLQMKALGEVWTITEATSDGSGLSLTFQTSSGRTILLQDPTLADNWDGQVEVDHSRIEDASLALVGSVTAARQGRASSVVTLENILYRLTVDPSQGSRAYIPEWHGVKEVLDEPEGLLSDSWDIRYQDLDINPRPPVFSLLPMADDQLMVRFKNAERDEYLFPFVSNKNGVFKWGSEHDPFVFEEARELTPAMTGELVYRTRFVARDGDFETTMIYWFHDPTDRVLTMEDEATSVWYSVTYTGIPGQGAYATLNNQGHEFEIEVLENNKIRVDKSRTYGTVPLDGYFLVSQDDDSAVLRYENVDLAEQTVELELQFADQPRTLVASYTGTPGQDAYGDFVVDFQHFRFWVNQDLTLTVDLDGDRAVSSKETRVLTDKNGYFDLAMNEEVPDDFVYMQFRMAASDDFNGEKYLWQVWPTLDNEIRIEAGDEYEGMYAKSDEWNMFAMIEDENDQKYAMTDYGVRISYNDPSTALGELHFDIPEAMNEPRVIVEMAAQ